MHNSTITAISTPPGTGGIAIIRLSGPEAFQIADKVWKGSKLSEAKSHTAHLGIITDSDGEILDQAVATIFDGGKSFTGEPTVEFSIHGSRWIQRRVVERLIEAGAHAASAGEFTQRAFINGRLDLAQAEAVADMIAASSKAAQRMAAIQMKGSFSNRLNEIRQQMIDLASLLELELDFSEEDVEFADRNRLLEMTRTTRSEILRLADSFHAGRALKEGVSVVIAGKPNAGKSTLLNCLLQDDKAIVSEIAGTTRDIIEDTAEINGILFRFIDTAGLRDTADNIERIGVDRALQALNKADILLWLTDPGEQDEYESPSPTESSPISDQTTTPHPTKGIPTLILKTKKDLNSPKVISCESSKKNTLPSSQERNISFNPSTQKKPSQLPQEIVLPSSPDRNIPFNPSSQEKPSQLSQEDVPINAKFVKGLNPRIEDVIEISAKTGEGIDTLIQKLTDIAEAGTDAASDLIVTNARHYESLTKAAEALKRVEENLTASLPPDLTAQDLREAIHHIGAITGAITPADLLQTIFSRFCIGK